MLRKKCKVLLSLVLVLSIVLIGVCHADTVYVAGAPTNNVGNNNQQGGAGVVSQQGTANTSGQKLYPGSIGNVDDSPQTVNITSPAANNAKINASTNGSTSNIITNGFSWSADTNTQEPVSYDISSPAAHQAEMKNGTQVTSIYGQDAGNMSYVAPGGSTQSTNYSSGGSTTSASQYPQSNTQSSQSIYSGASGAINGFNMHNVGIADPVINSDGAIVVNASTREIYYTKNPTKTYAPAGLTTLLTGYILLQYKGLNDTLVVTQSAVTGLESGANTVGLKAGDTITVKDALYALYIKSACDVAKVIAENVAGSEQAFVSVMNQTAASWGCTSTHFANSTGLNDNTQVTTPYDMAIIMSNVIQNATLNQVMQTPSYTLPATAHRKAMNITTKNEFINPSKSNYYQGIVCSRMGYTSKAKYTMGSFMIHNNQYLVAIVLYSNNTQYVDSKRLLNFARTAVDALGLTQAASFGQANVATVQSNIATAQTNVTTMASGSVSGDTQGVWQQDSKGWYFLKNNTTKAVNEWIQTNGKKYCVDSDGYMITGWREFSNGAIYYFNPSSGEVRASTWVNTSTGAYYLQADGTLARADKGQTKTISTQVGNYIIDENGKAIQKVN